MKASELRIGNYIEGFYETEIDRGNGIIEDVEASETVRVVGLDSCGFSEWSVWVEDGDMEEYDEFKPIPLTEEWLLKFGAKLQPWGWVLNEILIRWSKLGHKVFWIEIGNGKRIELPYVHTLQNFFALTGEELKIKEAVETIIE